MKGIKTVLIPIDDGTLEAGARAVEDELLKEIKRRKLEDTVKVLETGSIGVANKGVILIVYPDGTHYSNVKTTDVPDIVENHLVRNEVVERLVMKEEPKKEAVKYGGRKKETRILLKRVGVINPESIDEYLADGGYEALKKALKMKPENIVEIIKSSGLRGKGGAGFPTGIKWESVLNQKTNPKYVICNADEGEPGTFKDRVIIEGDPHRILEAMIIAGYSTGSNQGYIYIRGEYAKTINRMQKAIDDAYEKGFLGKSILGSGFDFDIEIKKGAGSYVCGEETALLESLEGKKAQPRHKPPFPTESGLWGKPTLINNVETLANIPDIILNGPEWFKKFGTEKSPGTKVFTLIGDVVHPGVVEVEMGTKLRELIYEYGGGIKHNAKFKAALIGGAAGAFLGKEMLDVGLSYEELGEYNAVLGSGAVFVMNENKCIVDVLWSIFRFFKHESCGQCVPCRIGQVQMFKFVEKVKNGTATQDILDKMFDLAVLMRDSLICALGQSAYLSISSAVRFFKDELEQHFKNKICPAGVCFREV